MTSTLQDRGDVRRYIRMLEKQISTCKDVNLRTDGLHKFGISVAAAPFAGISGKTGLDPCFFEPFHRHLLTPPRDGIVNHPFPEYQPDRLESQGERAQSLDIYFSEYLPDCGARRPEVRYNVFEDSGWCYKDVAEYKFRPLWEYDPPAFGGSIPKWSVQSIYHYRDQRAVPHIKSTMISDLDGDNATLFRGELLALIRMIRGRLATKGIAHHTHHPILLFSLMGPQHARILQAHLDGTQLIIQRSELYDFRHENVELLELFAQWFLSSPMGNTKPALQ